MCEKYCERFETLNPEVEFKKFLERKPKITPADQYETLLANTNGKTPYTYKGYGIEMDQNTMYRTSNSSYGYYAPNAFTVQPNNHALSQTFTNEKARLGMYHNGSLNLK